MNAIQKEQPATVSEFNARDLSRIKQGVEWIKGNSLHNPITDECTPDFSCCEPNIITAMSREERIEYFVKMAVRNERRLENLYAKTEQAAMDIDNYVDALKTLIETRIKKSVTI
jgi:hypothetical protein